MESNNPHLTILETAVRDYHEWVSRADDSGHESCLIIDRERNHFLCITIGWENGKRNEQTMIFARLKNGKIWIEIDWTNDGIATALIQAGIPNSEIVLGFLAPEERPLSEFALC